jgi:hypothetical protein
MTDFLLCWVIVLLATISMGIDADELLFNRLKTERKGRRELIGVMVTTFLVAVVFYAIFSFAWAHLLNPTAAR